MQDVFEFVDGLVAAGLIFRGWRAGNIEARVRGGQVNASHHQAGIEFRGVLEVLDGGVRLASLERVYALVQEVAGLELVAARNCQR